MSDLSLYDTVCDKVGEIISRFQFDKDLIFTIKQFNIFVCDFNSGAKLYIYSVSPEIVQVHCRVTREAAMAKDVNLAGIEQEHVMYERKISLRSRFTALESEFTVGMTFIDTNMLSVTAQFTKDDVGFAYTFVQGMLGMHRVMRDAAGIIA